MHPALPSILAASLLMMASGLHIEEHGGAQARREPLTSALQEMFRVQFLKSLFTGDFGPEIKVILHDKDTAPMTQRNVAPPQQPGIPAYYIASLPAAYRTNCQFLTLDVYTVHYNIDDPINCGNILCGGDMYCTHFTWLGPGAYSPTGHTNGVCILRSVPGSGSGWVSPFALPTAAVCGYIPERANAPLAAIGAAKKRYGI